MVQADGSFTVLFDKRTSGLPVRPRPTFTLTQSVREKDLMEAILRFLGVGSLHYNRDEINLVVTGLSDILKVIIPLFDSYPLLGSKLNAYLVFKKVVLMMANKEHLTIVGLLQIIKLAYFTNSTSYRTEASLSILMQLIKDKVGTLPAYTPVSLDTTGTMPFTMSLA